MLGKGQMLRLLAGNKAVLTLAVFLETMKALVGGSEPLDGGAISGVDTLCECKPQKRL